MRVHSNPTHTASVLHTHREKRKKKKETKGTTFREQAEQDNFSS